MSDDSDSYRYRAPAARVARLSGPRPPRELEALHVCPVCGDGRFQATGLGSTILLYCEGGCTGRQIAGALGLLGWPEVPYSTAPTASDPSFRGPEGGAA